MNETTTTATTSAAHNLAAGPTLGPSLLQAIAALLIVIGLIFLTAWLLRRFAFGGQLARSLRRTSPERTLHISETLWIDARHRLITVADTSNAARRYTLLIGPQQTLQLTENQGSSGHAAKPIV